MHRCFCSVVASVAVLLRRRHRVQKAPLYGRKQHAALVQPRLCLNLFSLFSFSIIND